MRVTYTLTLTLTRAAKSVKRRCRGRCQSSADRRGSGLGALLAWAEQPAARRWPPEEVLGLWVARAGRRGCPVHELRLPLPRVKSPPWHMKSVMTRWKVEPLK